MSDRSKDDVFGLLPRSEGWVEWFSWRPIKACGRWRWLVRVQRRRDQERGLNGSYLEEEWPWEYRAGRAHDYPDGDLGEPAHFYTHTCKHCGAKFTI